MAVTQIGKHREIVVVYCSAREAGLLTHQNLHQGFSEVSGQGKILKEVLTRDNGKKRWFLPSISPWQNHT